MRDPPKGKPFLQHVTNQDCMEFAKWQKHSRPIRNTILDGVEIEIKLLLMFTLKHSNYLSHTAYTKQEWLQDKVCQCP